MEREGLIHWIEELTKEDNDLVGKKCANLGELSRIGVRVPPGFAISVRTWERFIELTGIAGEMRRLFDRSRGELHIPAKGQKVSEEVRALLEAQEMPSEVGDLIRENYARLCEKAGMRDVPVAVRSAGAVSMPGAMETYLNVKGEEDVLRKVLQVWGSSYTYRAVLYRHNNNLSAEYAPIGVAVLQLVDAKTAGVLMTANPTSGNTLEMVMESNWGLGESVVSGIMNPDRFSVNKKDMAITGVINKKLKRVVPVTNGSEVVDIPKDMQETPSLSDDEIRLLVGEALKIENHFGGPTDIEWAYSADKSLAQSLYFLQARPMKPLPEYKDAVNKILDMMLA